MSTSVPGSGVDAFGYFYTSGIPRTVENMIKIQSLIFKLGDDALSSEASGLLTSLLRTVNATAVEFAGLSVELIVARIMATKAPNRPSTGSMETHIVSKPGALGLVSVGLMDDLNKIINPSGYGTFWRAQEFGTGEGGVPSQVDRVLFGTFEPSETPPDKGQAGLRAGHDLAFFSQGTNPGFGTISVDLPPRHFLLDGGSAAGAAYVATMAEIQAMYLAKLKDLMGRVKARRSPRTFTGIISA
jgi:hypothetical protein